jgi:hypothetical protein
MHIVLTEEVARRYATGKVWEEGGNDDIARAESRKL